MVRYKIEKRQNVKNMNGKRSLCWKRKGWKDSDGGIDTYFQGGL